jgi:succinate-semialdehyde dehydrogenase/glutarate-semialdehyde dehydrogenase/aspartate-semialdehyde dehydrogenase
MSARAALAGLRDAGLLRDAAWVGGQWRRDGGRLAVVDPANGDRVAEVPDLPSEAAREAVEAAEAARHPWAARLPADRGQPIRRWSALMREASEDLATILTVEQGKPLAEARGEIAYAAGFLDWFAAETERTWGETPPAHKPDSMLSVSQQPVGVVLAITPWNFPSAMITRKAGAALAAGCAVIVKPAPETPLSALALAVLAERAGIPGGVFQVLTGDAPRLTAALLAEPLVRAISFTGSTGVGRLIQAQSAARVRRIQLELGGHAPFIGFGDTSLSALVDGAMAAKFATSGQDCLAANRVFIEAGAYEPFVSAFAARTAALTCRAQIADALARGARLMTGGTEAPLGQAFVVPTVLADVPEGARILHEETFGPVAAILPFRTEAEVVARANATDAGLAAYLYTRDVNRVARITRALDFGMIGVNTASFTGPPIPFGGWKQSGLGREGGIEGIRAFLETKYVCIGNIAA